MGFVSKPVTEKNGVTNTRFLEIPFDGKFLIFFLNRFKNDPIFITLFSSNRF